MSSICWEQFILVLLLVFMFMEFFSNSWKICRGVRQGGVTSAFNLYIDDIFNYIVL